MTASLSKVDINPLRRTDTRPARSLAGLVLQLTRQTKNVGISVGAVDRIGYGPSRLRSTEFAASLVAEIFLAD
jgi:hypothetical protein